MTRISQNSLVQNKNQQILDYVLIFGSKCVNTVDTIDRFIDNVQKWNTNYRKRYAGMEKTIAESQGIQYTKAYDFKYL